MTRSKVGFVLSTILAVGASLITAWPARAHPAPKPNYSQQIDGAEVDIWVPSEGNNPRPLVLFSHGVSGCRDQSAYLMTALAQAGMIVAAPDHGDQRCNQPLTEASLPQDIKNPLLFKDTTYLGRRNQLRALLDSLIADPELGKRIDPNKLILVGHSLGGYTVLALAGAQAGAVPAGLKAVVALAPYLLPYGGIITLPIVGTRTLPNAGTPDMVKVPVLIEAGAQDSASATLANFAPRLGGKVCTQVFPDAQHFAWVDSPDLPDDLRQSEYQIATATAAITFIQQVLDTGIPKTPEQSTPPAVVACN